MSKLTERKLIEICCVDTTEKEFIIEVFNNYACEAVFFVPYIEFKETLNKFTTPFPHWFQELLLKIGNYRLDNDDMLYFW